MEIDEAYKTARMMIQRGGSFVKKLGDMLVSADHINAQKIKDTWPEYWKEYFNMYTEEKDEALVE